MFFTTKDMRIAKKILSLHMRFDFALFLEVFRPPEKHRDDVSGCLSGVCEARSRHLHQHASAVEGRSAQRGNQLT